METRRSFIKKSALGLTGLAIGGRGMSARSYKNIIGSNDRVRVGVLGFSYRYKNSLGKAFLKYSKEMNFELYTICDIWNRRRDEGQTWYKAQTGGDIRTARNTDELWSQKPDAVIISTADFQHALHTAEAVRAGCDVYCEKPFAETMDDANFALKAARETNKVIQIGSQRRSGTNYHAANDYIKSGKFGKIIAVEMTWNVNQLGRWRLPQLTKEIREQDTDWKRFLMNRPYESWDPRKYLEYRLFWPYSSGIPGQWMAHQIDTVHWFSGLEYPRSVVANGGIYMWNDGRTNYDTITAVFDYGKDKEKETGNGFQVIYSSRQNNSSGGTKEWYFSNGGKLDLDTNIVNNDGGLTEGYFSGTATYFNSFSLREDEANNKTLLDLGEVKDVTEIFINGESAGILWKEPYSLEITNLVKAGDNELKIEVVNMWVNRLTGDMHLSPEKRFCSTNQNYMISEVWPGGDETFRVQKAGLLGPVNIKMSDK